MHSGSESKTCLNTDTKLRNWRVRSVTNWQERRCEAVNSNFYYFNSGIIIRLVREIMSLSGSFMSPRILLLKPWQTSTSPTPRQKWQGGEHCTRSQLFILCASVPDPWHFSTDPDPRIRPTDILSFFADYFMKVHLHHSSRIKSPKEVTIKIFFLLILLDDVRIRTRTNNDESGSRRSKNIPYGSEFTTLFCARVPDPHYLLPPLGPRGGHIRLQGREDPISRKRQTLLYSM